MADMSEEKQPSFTFVKDAGFRSVYANQAQFSSTAFDFAMSFGEITEVSPDASSATVEQRVRVLMSPLHFKVFAMVAVQNVKNWEERFGEIKPPEGSFHIQPPSSEESK